MIDNILSALSAASFQLRAEATAFRSRSGRPLGRTVSISDASIVEGNSGTTSMVFTVTLSRTSLTPVTVNYATADGSATAGSDYLRNSGTITFSRGQSTQTINIGVLGDITVEPDENFAVTLSSPAGCTLARATGIGTIRNDDVAAAPAADGWKRQFFAPYVQMSGWPTPNLIQMSTAAGTSRLILSFIQADANGQPSWGGRSTLEPTSANSQAQTIKTSIASFEATGGEAMISFGGADGTSLSQYYAANNLGAQALADAYWGIAKTYGVNHLDFDIEGAALSNKAAVQVQAQALRLLQQAHPDINVWLTLPVLPSGFLPNGMNAVDAALKAGVNLDGVNIMAMDYGESAAPTTGPNGKTMGAYAIEAAQSSYSQLKTLFSTYGQPFGWAQLGITPIIGVNDVTTEVFTATDARTLEAFAAANGIRMLSMWALERDTPGALGQAVWNASGLGDPAGTFSGIFNGFGSTASAVV